MSKYAKVTLKRETWENFRRKNKQMNELLKEYGVKRRVPMTRMLDAISKRTFWFQNDEVVNLSKMKGRGMKL